MSHLRSTRQYSHGWARPVHVNLLHPGWWDRVSRLIQHNIYNRQHVQGTKCPHIFSYPATLTKAVTHSMLNICVLARDESVIFLCSLIGINHCVIRVPRSSWYSMYLCSRAWGLSSNDRGPIAYRWWNVPLITTMDWGCQQDDSLQKVRILTTVSKRQFTLKQNSRQMVNWHTSMQLCIH